MWKTNATAFVSKWDSFAKWLFYFSWPELCMDLLKMHYWRDSGKVGLLERRMDDEGHCKIYFIALYWFSLLFGHENFKRILDCILKGHHSLEIFFLVFLPSVCFCIIFIGSSRQRLKFPLCKPFVFAVHMQGFIAKWPYHNWRIGNSNIPLFAEIVSSKYTHY